MKTCLNCGVEKPFTEFSRRARSHDGYQPWCKECNYSHKKAWLDTPEGKESKRWNSIWTKYRLRKEDYDRMLTEQNNACKICERVFTDVPQIDHCHRTGRVRGLLCGGCNKALGVYESIMTIADKFEKYLLVER